MKQSQLDGLDILQRTFDESKNAFRMTGDSGISLTSSPIQHSVGEVRIERVEVPVIVREPQIEKIEIETVRYIEIPKIVEIVKEIPVYIDREVLKLERIEIPVIVREKEIVEVTKEIIVEKKEFEKFPMWLRICIISQTGLALFTLLIRLIGNFK